MERNMTHLNDIGLELQMSWLPISKTMDILSSELPVRWIGAGKRWTTYDSLQSGFFERRAFMLHHQFCKSAQHLRTSRVLVSKIFSAYSCSIIFNRGETNRESERAVSSKFVA